MKGLFKKCKVAFRLGRQTEYAKSEIKRLLGKDWKKQIRVYQSFGNENACLGDGKTSVAFEVHAGNKKCTKKCLAVLKEMAESFDATSVKYSNGILMSFPKSWHVGFILSYFK